MIDPTRQKEARLRAFRAFKQRLARAEARVIARFKQIPRQRVDAVWVYAFGPAGQERFQSDIEAYLAEETETEDDTVPFVWWWGMEYEPSYRQGSIVAITALAQIAAKEQLPVLVTPEALLNSPDYQLARETAIVKQYPIINGLTQDVVKDVIRQINIGIESGLSQTAIIDLIAERFKIARGKAARIVVTEINKAYNDGIAETAQRIGQQIGVRMGVLHISALIPTTRQHHADRHGEIYTVADQTRWWNEGANRINCHCSTQPINMDADNSKLQNRLRQERLRWRPAKK